MSETPAAKQTHSLCGRSAGFWRLAAPVICALLAGLSALAQAPIGNISGVVTDPSGAVIAGATVATISLSAGGKRTATTNEQGYFLISSLQPGEYRLTFEYQGFANAVVERVVVEVGQTARVDVKMSLAAAVSQVVVEGQVVGVNTTQSTVGGVVNPQQIDQLPLNGRNYLELAKLEPGVEIQEGRSFDPTKTRYTGVSVGGRNGREARITLDGVDAVDEHVGTTTLNLSQESIQEFQVSLSSSDLSTGLSATGAINIITKSGTNTFHGGAFLFGRGASIAARPGFALTQPDFDREQYGVNIGGPVRRDQLFFFGNFEKTRENSAISINTPYFPSLTSFPAPFGETSNNVRADWHLPHEYLLFFRWSRDDNSNLGGFGGSVLPSSGNVNANTTNQYVWGLDSAFTPRLANTFRAALTNFKNFVLPPPADAAAIIVPGTQGFRIVTDDNRLVSGPDINTPQSTFELFGQFRDDLTYAVGKHAWRLGGDIVQRKVTVTNFVAGFPSLNVVSPASPNPSDILAATINTITIGNKNGKRIPATPDNSHRNTRISWYVDDTWRLLSNFTLTYGLRYEVDTHPLNNDLNKPDIARPLLPNGTAPTPIDKDNFAPHVGFAWDPFHNHRTSIRAGAGIYYAMRISNLVTNERATLAPFNSGNDTILLTPDASGLVDFKRDGTLVFDFAPAIKGTVQTALPIISAGQRVYVSAPPLSVPTLQITGTGLLISNNLETPYSQQVNVGVQRELPLGSLLDVNFLYTRTVHEIMRDIDAANLFPGNGAPITLGDGSRPSRQITLVRSDGFSRYRALTVKWDKRFSHHYQFTASYALSRLETTIPDGLGLGAGALVNRNPQANFGPGALDRTHRLTLNGIAELPYGFRVSMITTAYSGLPNSIVVGSADLNGDGINGSLLPGTRRGSLGREVDTPAKLNELIRAYNRSTAGRTLPRPKTRAPFVLEVPDNISFGDSFISTDLQITKVFSIKERVKLELSAQMFNLFNVSNLVGPAGLPTTPFNGTLTTIGAKVLENGSVVPTGNFTLDTTSGSLLNNGGNRALAGVDRPSGFASFSATRPVIPTGTGLPRAAQFGLRVSF